MRLSEESLRDVFGDRRKLAAAVVAVLALVSVPFTTTAFVTEIIFLGLVFTMLGVSWNLLAGYAGQISLGHAAFFGIGAFVTAWLTTPGRAGFPESIQTPVLLALVVGGVAAALLALVTGPIIFRLTGHYFAIGTLALATIIQLLLLEARGISGGSAGYYVRGGIGEDAMFLVALVATLGMLAATYRIVDSPLGLGMRAIHDDETAASSLGIHPLKYKMYAFVISSFMAGLAGATYAQFTLFVNPESTLSVVWTIDTLVVVILGGMGTMAGPVLGAALFLGLNEGLRAVAGELATTVEGSLLILFIIFAPGGVYGLIRKRLDADDPPTEEEETAPLDRVTPESE
jgi:branched-chain amino acid transport system permease protein